MKMKMKISARILAVVMSVGIGLGISAPPVQAQEAQMSDSSSLLSFGFTASQINSFMYVAYTQGDTVAAYLACGYRTNFQAGTAWNDCYYLLTLGWQYSYPLMQYVAAYGHGIVFQWYEPSNTYKGFVVV